MHAVRQLLSIFILATLIEIVSAAPPPSTTTVLEGTITLVDTNRDLVVIQQEDHPMALRLDSIPQPLRVGERIQIEGTVSPYFMAFPDYPNRPSGREIANSFEAPTDWAKNYLTRMHGFLKPPVDGKYTFWIAGDDEAELLLGSSGESTNARQIAFAPRATWPREWDRYPQQKSEEIFLKAGETYYIEALQRQWRGHDCLAVAWQGPGLKQGIIDGKYLSPNRNFSTAGGRGVLREYWTNFFLTTLSTLVPEPPEQSVGLSQPHIKVLEAGALPQAGLIRIGEPWGAAHNFQWVEVEARSVFAANNDGAITLELTNVDGRMTAHIFNWGTNSTASLENRKVRLRGVCENVTSEKGELVAGTLWVPGAREISLLDFTEKDWNGLEPVPMFDLVPSNPKLAWGRKVLVHGTVIEQDPKTDALSVQGDDSFYGYYSDDGSNWTQIGVPVSIAISNSVYAGLAISSMASYPLPTATFDQNRELSETSPLTNGGSYRNATFTTQAGSGGIDDTDEKCKFLFKSLADEGEIVTQVKTFHGTHVSDKGGLMIRESLDTVSPSVALMVTPELKITLQYQTPGASSRTVAQVLNRTPRWLKLVRRRHRLTVLPEQHEEFSPYQSVEIIGNLTWQNNFPVLTEAALRPASAPPAPADKQPQTPKAQYVSIKDLPSENEEGLQYASQSFRIRGVVTFSDRLFNRNLLFMQDDSGGALVRVLPELFQYKPLEVGQFIEAEGTIKFLRTAQRLSGWARPPCWAWAKCRARCRFRIVRWPTMRKASGWKRRAS